jgi:hypothetical protein
MGKVPHSLLFYHYSKEESVKISNIHLLLYTAFKWITHKQDNSRIYVRWCI